MSDVYYMRVTLEIEGKVSEPCWERVQAERVVGYCTDDGARIKTPLCFGVCHLGGGPVEDGPFTGNEAEWPETVTPPTSGVWHMP